MPKQTKIAEKIAHMPKWVKGQSGNPKGAPKGGNPGAGRPPDWLRERCQKAVVEGDLIGFLERVATGQDEEQVVSDKGEVLRVPAAIRDRHRATETLLDRGYGKPDQSINTNVTQDGQRPDIAELLSSIRAITETLERLDGGNKVETGK